MKGKTMKADKSTTTAAIGRSSEMIRGEIGRLRTLKAESQASLDKLVRAYDVDLRSGDDAADRNERETTVLRRTVRRCELDLLDLEKELAAAQAEEQRQRDELKKREAENAVQAIIAEVEDHYVGPAKAIAAFLQRYRAAEKLAYDAGVPTFHQRARCTPDIRRPERVETYTVYVDEFGSETGSPVSGGSYVIDAQGQRRDHKGNVVVERPKKTKRRIIDAEIIRGRSLPPLPELVRLPAIEIDRPDFHVGALTYGEPN